MGSKILKERMGNRLFKLSRPTLLSHRGIPVTELMLEIIITNFTGINLVINYERHYQLHYPGNC